LFFIQLQRVTFYLGDIQYIFSKLDYAQVFNQAMSSYSSAQTNWVLEAFDGYDFSNIHHICDIGGGTGHLIANLLVKYPHMKGTVLELESVVRKKELLLAPKLGVSERCSYVAGDMFCSNHSQLPSADAYIMKMILHDWSDEECVDHSQPRSGTWQIY
jgi:hypothetical protein